MNMSKFIPVLLVAGAVSSASALELTSFSGSPSMPGSATLSFSAASTPRELWYAWDGSDKGDALAAWPLNERVAVVAANATTATVTLPPNAVGAASGRFFLVAAGGSYDVGWIRTAGGAAIDTGELADPQTKIVADFELDDLETTQQYIFGAIAGNLVVGTYINGTRYWAWAAQDSSGNWTSTDVPPAGVRYQVTLDLPGAKYELRNVAEDRVVRTMAMSTARTKTASVSLTVMASKANAAPIYRNFAEGRLYGFSIVKNGAEAMALVPSVRDGVAGLRDTVGGGFYANVAGGEVRAGGRTGDVAGEATDALRLYELRRGDVWSDAKYLWDFSRDPNGDGQISSGDFRNALQYGSAAQSGWNKTPELFNGASAGLNGLAWKQVDVRESMRGVTRAGGMCLDIPANTRDNAGKRETWRNCVQYANASVPNDMTLVARVYPRRFDYDSCENATSIFFYNGLEWGNYRGSEFGFEFTHGLARPYSIVGQTTLAMDRIDNAKLTTNRWYDVAYSVKKLDGGFAKLMMAVAAAGDPASGGAAAGSTGLVYKAWIIGSGHVMTNEAAPGASYIRIGCESGGKNGWDASDNRAKAFNGMIQRIAVWPRALSLDEIREAFVQTPALMRVGTENGSAGEFGPAAETPDVFACDAEPWSRFRGTLTAARPEVTIEAPVRGDMATVAQVLRVRTAPASGRAELRATVNGYPLGSKILEPGAAKSWFVPANVLGASKTKATVKLARASGSGDCAIDFVEMAGSTMIGKDDNTNSEFTQEGWVQNETAAGSWDFKLFQRAVLGSWQGQEGALRRKAHVMLWVPPELAANNVIRYTGCIVGQGGDSNWTGNKEYEQYGYKLNQWPVTVLVNEREVYKTQGQPNGTKVEIEFEPGELKGGWNRVAWYAHGSGKYWLCMDFHRLEVLDNPHGTILFVR